MIGIAAAFAAWNWSETGETWSQNAQANQAFLNGDVSLKKRLPCDSIPYFQEAVTHDPNFARAYANLAAAQAMCPAIEGVEENIARALALNPNSAEARATDGFIRMFRHWDWEGAEISLRRAVALNPNSATAHHWLGVYLSIRGRLSEAKGEMRRAIDIDPTSPLYHADLGEVYYFLRDFDFAADYCQKALALDSDFHFANLYLRDIHLVLGQEKEAMEYEIKAVSYGKPLDFVTKMRETLERDGFRGYWQYQLDQKLNEWNGNNVSPERRDAYRYQIARLYAALGDKENALRWFDEAVSVHEGIRPFKLAYLGVDLRYDALRDDPRFAEILRKINLTDNQKSENVTPQ